MQEAPDASYRWFRVLVSTAAIGLLTPAAKADSPPSINVPTSSYLAAASANEKWLCVKSDNQAFVYSIADGKQIAVLNRERKDKLGVLRFSSDSKYIASPGRDGVISIWETSSWKQVMRWQDEDPEWPAQYDTLAFSPDSSTLVAVGYSGYFEVFDVKSGKHSHKLEPFPFDRHSLQSYDCEFLPDGKGLVVSGARDLHFFDTSDWRLSSQIPIPKGFVGEIGISPDGKYLINTDLHQGGRLYVWMHDDKQFRLIDSPEGKWGRYFRFQFSPDSSLMAMSGEKDARVFELTKDGLKERYIYRAKYPPAAQAFGGAALLSSGRRIAILDDREIKYVDLKEAVAK